MNNLYASVSNPLPYPYNPRTHLPYRIRLMDRHLIQPRKPNPKRNLHNPNIIQKGGYVTITQNFNLLRKPLWDCIQTSLEKRNTFSSWGDNTWLISNLAQSISCQRLVPLERSFHHHFPNMAWLTSLRSLTPKPLRLNPALLKQNGFCTMHLKFWW